MATLPADRRTMPPPLEIRCGDADGALRQFRDHRQDRLGEFGRRDVLAGQTVVPGLGVPPHIPSREDEVFFEELATGPADVPPDLAGLAGLCGRYGIEFV